MAAREKTRYTGVYVRTSTSRRYQGKPDVCFDIAYKVDGKLIWEKIGWRSEGYTAVLASEIRGDRIRSKRHPDMFPASKTLNMTYGQAWNIFKERHLPNLKNQATYLGHHSRYIGPFFDDTPLSQITLLYLENFKASLLRPQRKSLEGNYPDKILAPASINHILLTVTNVLGKMVEWGFSTGPVPKIKLLRVENARQRFLTPKEVERLFDLLQILSCRVYRVAVISMHTGMRAGEILKLRRQDLDFDNKLIYVDGKTGKRTAYMDNTVVRLLERILPSSQESLLFYSRDGKPIDSNWIRPTFNKAVGILGLNSGVTDRRFKVVFHTLRHTFCSWLASQNVPLYTIGTLVGHQSTRSTQRYAKLSPDAKWEALSLIEKTVNAHKF